MYEIDGAARPSVTDPPRPRPLLMLAGCSACGAGEVGGDDVGGVPVQGDSGAVVAHGRSRVGVRSRFLDVAQRDASVQGGGDERVAQRVRSDPLVDAGAARDPPDDAAGAVPIHPLPVRAQEDRPVEDVRRWPGRRHGRCGVPAGW